MTTGEAEGQHVSGVSNFRDVGGLPAGPTTTRAGVLFRSGNLARLDDDGREALRALGIRRIIDLRADEEIAYAPSRIDGLDVQTQRVPLFTGSVSSMFEEDLTLAEMYRRIVDDSAARVVEVIRGLLVDQPVVVHCTVGKDRTGVTIAIALAAAGVDHAAIIADYARTEALLSESRNRHILEYLRLQHPDAVNVRDLATRSPAEVMRALLDGLTQRYGSAGRYLRSHGVSEDELRELQRVMLT